MDILLTHGYFLQEDEKEKRIMKPYVPLGMLYISAWLEKTGFDNEVFDSTFSSFDLLTEKLLLDQPRIVAIYTNLMTKLNVLRIISFIRSQERLAGTKIILGGPEVRNHAEKFLQHGADYIVCGEGEMSMQELCTVLLRNQGTVETIAGVAYLSPEGQLIRNAEREKLKDLDLLPDPNRRKVNMQLYFDAWKSRHGSSSASVNTMRGCPYSCRWCSRAVYGQSYRRRSPAHVVAELERIQKTYAVDQFWFVDDVFTISHKWLAEFDQVLKEKKLRIRYECITRADRMNEEVIGLLKSSGCFRVWIGAESGSQPVIDRMDRRVEVKQVREMIRASRRGGLEAGTFIMVGYPGETKEDLRETVRHLKEAGPDHFTITVTYPITGTELYKEVETAITQKPDWNQGTDRDIDFKRTYPREYYDHAVQMISNEVWFHKSFRHPLKNIGEWPIFKFRAIRALRKMKRMESEELRVKS